MKTKIIKNPATFSEFLKNKIKKPNVITGGTSGPIERDKVKRPISR